MGRNVDITPEILERICERLADGEGLKKICRDDDMPAHRTLYDLRKKDPEVKKMLQDARDVGTEGMMDETIDIARKPYAKDAHGKIDPAEVAARKLEIWTVQQHAKSFNPEMFGDKIKQELSGGIKVVSATPEDERL